MAIRTSRLSISSDTIAALTWYQASMTAELAISKLNERLEAFGQGKRKVPFRHQNDAVRLAFSTIVKESSVVRADGAKEELDIKEIDKKFGDPSQRWSVHARKMDRNNQTLSYTRMGYIELKADGMLSLPGEMDDYGDRIQELVNHYTATADHTKLRDCLKGMLKEISQIKLNVSSVNVISPSGVSFLRETVAPIFENLDKGTITISVYELEGTPAVRAQLKNDIEGSLSGELDTLASMVFAAHSDTTGVTKGKVKEWLQQIKNLKDNMDMLNILKVKLPIKLSTLEDKLADISASIGAPRAAPKRVVGKLVIADDDDEDDD